MMERLGKIGRPDMKPWIAPHAAFAPGTSSRTLVRIARGCLLWLAAATTLASGARAQERETNEAWRIIVPPQSSLVFARDGSLIGEIGKQKRTLVSIRSRTPSRSLASGMMD